MKRFIAVFAAVLITGVAINVSAGPKLDKVLCPVSGKKVLADKTADYKGGQVYFCCANCPGTFAKATAKFAAKANHQLAQTGQFTQVKCIFKGTAINPTKTCDVAGVKVGLCCGGCQGKLNKAEDKVALAFSDTAFTKGFAKVKAKK